MSASSKALRGSPQRMRIKDRLQHVRLSPYESWPQRPDFLSPLSNDADLLSRLTTVLFGSVPSLDVPNVLSLIIDVEEDALHQYPALATIQNLRAQVCRVLRSRDMASAAFVHRHSLSAKVISNRTRRPTFAGKGVIFAACNDCNFVGVLVCIVCWKTKRIVPHYSLRQEV